MKPYVKEIYSDNHLLVLDKPAGMLTQPNETGEISLQCLARERHKFLHPLHRLDRGASGIVLFAKTSKALSRLQESLKGKKWEKKYVALVAGVIDPNEGMMEDLIEHVSHKARIGPQGKAASLLYKTKHFKKNCSLIEIVLLTGRYHQIRVQFASRGFPLLGDTKYGSQKSFENGIALHHTELTIEHPITHSKITFNSAADRLHLNEFC